MKHLLPTDTVNDSYSRIVYFLLQKAMNLELFADAEINRIY